MPTPHAEAKAQRQHTAGATSLAECYGAVCALTAFESPRQQMHTPVVGCRWQWGFAKGTGEGPVQAMSKPGRLRNLQSLRRPSIGKRSKGRRRLCSCHRL